MPKKNLLINQGNNKIIVYGLLAVIISCVLVSYGLSLLAFDSQIKDQSLFASAYVNPPSGGGSSGGGGHIMPSEVVIALSTAKDAAKLLEDFDSDDVAKLLEKLDDVEHVASIITYFDLTYASSVLSYLSQEIAGQLLIIMNDEFAIDLLLELTQDDTSIIESMIDFSFNDSVFLIEGAIKKALSLSESEKIQALEKLSQSIGSVDPNILIELFVSIARLPETPSTVAYLFDAMQLTSVIDVTNIWLMDETYEYALIDLANVFNFLSIDRVGELYKTMTGEERIILLEYLSENVITSLPVIGEFQVKNLVSEPSEVEEGQTVTISYTIENIGTETDDYIIPLKINGETQFTEEGVLSPSESVDITHSIIKESPGTYRLTVLDETNEFIVKTYSPIIELLPAEFIITSLTVTPLELFKGDLILVLATIENIGELSGSSVIELNLDSLLYKAKEAFVLADEQVIILFEVNADLSTGLHELSVMDMTASFEVIEPPQPNIPYVTIFTIIVILAAGGYYYLKRTDIDLETLLQPLRR